MQNEPDIVESVVDSALGETPLAIASKRCAQTPAVAIQRQRPSTIT